MLEKIGFQLQGILKKINDRGVFSNLPNICNGAYLPKYSVAKAVNYILVKNYILDVWQGPKQIGDWVLFGA